MGHSEAPAMKIHNQRLLLLLLLLLLLVKSDFNKTAFSHAIMRCETRHINILPPYAAAITRGGGGAP